MKKLFFVLLLFLAFSVQNFATTAIVKVEVAILEKEEINTGLDSDLGKALSTGETKNTGENDENTDLNEDELFGCVIATLVCSCQNVVTQWCDGGLHGTLMEWYTRICNQACNPTEV